MSNKVYLADKATLDSVKATVDAVNSGVGSVSAQVSAMDTNVTSASSKMNTVDTKIGAVNETAELSLFGKINALLRSWTAERAAKIDTIAEAANTAAEGAHRMDFSVGSQEGAVLDESGSVHGKLLWIINAIKGFASGYPTAPVDVDCPQQKILVRGGNPEIQCTPNSGNWHIGAVRIAVPGVVHAVYIDSPITFSKGARVTIDNSVYEIGKPNSGDMNYIVQTIDGRIQYVSNPSGSVPIRFKNQFIVDIETNGVGNTMPTLRVNYETYEDYPEV